MLLKANWPNCCDRHMTKYRRFGQDSSTGWCANVADHNANTFWFKFFSFYYLFTTSESHFCLKFTWNILCFAYSKFVNIKWLVSAHLHITNESIQLKLTASFITAELLTKWTRLVLFVHVVVCVIWIHFVGCFESEKCSVTMKMNWLLELRACVV